MGRERLPHFSLFSPWRMYSMTQSDSLPPSSQPSVGNGTTSSAPAPTPVGASPSPLSEPPPPPPSRVLPPVGSYACQPPPYPPPKKKSGLRSCLVALLVLVVLMAIVLTPLLVGGYFLLDSFSSDFQLAKAMSSSRTMIRHKSIRTVACALALEIRCGNRRQGHDCQYERSLRTVCQPHH